MSESKLWMYVRQKFKAVNKARKLQAKEYERRLETLNHEAARLSLMIPKEQFDIVIDQIKGEIKILQLWKANSEGRTAKSQIISIVSIIVAVIAIVLSFIKK